MDQETVAKIRAGVSKPKTQWDNAAMKAQQAGTATGPVGFYGSCECPDTRQVSPAEQIIHDLASREQRVKEEGEKAKQALDFFENNPAFAEFITLVRSGAIQF